MFVCLSVRLSFRLSVHYASLNSWTDFDEICCVLFEWFPGWFRFTIEPVYPTRGGDQIGILRFTMDIFIYKWLLLLVVGEIISRNYIYYFIGCYWLIGQIRCNLASNQMFVHCLQRWLCCSLSAIRRSCTYCC